MEISLNFFWYFFHILSKREKMNHKISCVPFLHERSEQKSQGALSRGSPLLRFSRWSPALQQLDVIRCKSLEAERDTNSRGWGGEESASLAEKLVKSIFLFGLLVSKYQHISKQKKIQVKRSICSVSAGQMQLINEIFNKLKKFAVVKSV